MVEGGFVIKDLIDLVAAVKSFYEYLEDLESNICNYKQLDETVAAVDCYIYNIIHIQNILKCDLFDWYKVMNDAE